jgi:uncharacterized protein (UPF0276 family)
MYAAVSLNLDRQIIAACLPLFESEKIGAVEWSFDTLYSREKIPEWFVELLQSFGKEQRLVGHGVYYSLFSGGWSAQQDAWLQHLSRMASKFHFDQVSEHFGFMTGEDFHKGAPLPIPFTTTTLAIGRDRLNRLYHACECPVGLENLAFAYSGDEVKKHGEFLDQLVQPINGFLILDLHNIYCQACNFGIPADQLLTWFPLHRVREIHISGGSWEDSVTVKDKRTRRDTHDDRVPDEVFELLRLAIPLCPHLKYVVLEQLGIGLDSDAKQLAYREDFLRMEGMVSSFTPSHSGQLQTFLPHHPVPPGTPREDHLLATQQVLLSTILENASSYHEALAQLRVSPLADTAWAIEKWEPQMLETAVAIARKWKDGFN